jgi:multicomponent K+:H+ antiporter subunit D
MALGLDSDEAVSAALYYILNSTLVGGGLFLLSGLVARERGYAGGRLDQAFAVARPALLGSLFFLGAVAIAGLPPLAGFVGKLYILQSALVHPAAAWVLGVVMGSSLLIIVALSRAGSGIFWRTGGSVVSVEPAENSVATLSAVLLLSGTLVLVIAAGPVTSFTRAAASQLSDRASYLHAVMANRGVSTPAISRDES